MDDDCATYDAATRTCAGGTSRAFVHIREGLKSLNAGDTIYLREGSYGQLNVQRSGTPSEPISINGYVGESVVISVGGDVGIRVVDQTDIRFANLTVANVQGFGRIENSYRIEFDSIEFSNAGASGTTGALKFVRSTHNRVSNSSFGIGSDLLLLQDASNFNVIQGNSFGNASHSQISIRCSSQNVLRQNRFENPDQKLIEMFDCEGISDAPVRLNDARRNLVERNMFLGTPASYKSHNYNAIQHGGQQSIVRLNVFAYNLGGGVNYQNYAKECLYVNENRLYNNTFYANRCYGIIGQSGSPSNMFYDNRVVNNLLYLNRDCSGAGRQVSIRDRRAVILTANSREKADPGFVNAATNDFNLVATSDQIDAGAFVARAVTDGSGSVLVLDDASWFYDGFGISGETGDMIRIQGQNESARIVSIDYEANSLTLSRDLTWSSGDGVHLDYSGDAPDVGAFEFGLHAAD